MALTPEVIDSVRRRATSEITTPSSQLSATIASFSSSVQSRRRPVMTSTRAPREASVLNLRSTLWSNRWVLMAAHHARPRDSAEDVVRASLTLARIPGLVFWRRPTTVAPTE